MGHYCYFCDEKLVGGMVPQCCDGIECICEGCYEDAMNNRMSVELSNYLRDNFKVEDKEARVHVNEELLVWLKQKKPLCPECGTDWTTISFEPY